MGETNPQATERGFTSNSPGAGTLWGLWVLATAVGSTLALLLANGVLSAAQGGGAGGLILLRLLQGAGVGVAQWLVLRPYLPRLAPWLWPVATAAGMVLAALLVVLAPGVANYLASAGCFAGAIAGGLIAAFMGPLQSRLSNMVHDPRRRLFGCGLLAVLAILSVLIGRASDAFVENVEPFGDETTFVMRNLTGTYLTWTAAGLAQLVVLRRYLSSSVGWGWVFASFIGGSLAGLVAALLFRMTMFEGPAFVGLVVIPFLAAALAALATGFVLSRRLAARRE